jgi:hypothetical protein
VERIEESVKPSGRQRNALDNLEKVSAQAAEALRGACPTRAPENPVARLDAMGGRLQAMVHAAEELRPKLGAFYAFLAGLTPWVRKTPGWRRTRIDASDVPRSGT